MAETKTPHRKLIIKIYSRRPEKRVQSEDSTTVSKVCELKNKKGYYAEAIWVNVENPSRISRRSKEECRLKSKKEEEGVEWKKRKVEEMESCKKMQCWAMLKRLMVGKDAWALKKPLLDPKVLYVLDKCEAMRKPKGLEDIESKLKKKGYSDTDEFADDVRLVLSYALQYPPRSEVHKTARRISEGFELRWKTMKKKWMLEVKERNNKICKREHHNY